MIIWVDAQLPPAIAPWITDTFGIEAKAVRDLGLRDATDRQIFLAAKRSSQSLTTSWINSKPLSRNISARSRIALIEFPWLYRSLHSTTSSTISVGNWKLLNWVPVRSLNLREQLEKRKVG